MAQPIAMTDDLYHACATRDLSFLQEQTDECLKFSKTSAEGNTILHIILDPAFVDRHVDMTPILQRVPELISIVNNRGDNPVHYAARITSRVALEFLSSCKEIWSRCASTNSDSPPWLVRNLEGNIPLHEALLSRHAICAQVLIELDNKSAQFCNASKETPLHLCARYTQECSASLVTRDDVVALRGTDELTLLLNAYAPAAFLRDADSFTPIMRAAKCGRLQMVNKIRERYPDSAKLRDSGGRTFLHVLHVSKMEEATFFETLPIGSQMATLQDNDGNTPLHLAVKRRQYRKIRVLAGIKETWDAVLNIEDSDGATPFDLIRSQGDAPLKIRMMVRPKSSESIVNDVSEATLRSHFNYLSIASILLATFTFAAAYSVPGGFDSATGSPVLVNTRAFKAFVILDSCALSLSFLVLLSIMCALTGGVTESLRFINGIIFSFQIACMAALGAFMLGIYATMYHRAKGVVVAVLTIGSVSGFISLIIFACYWKIGSWWRKTFSCIVNCYFHTPSQGPSPATQTSAPSAGTEAPVPPPPAQTASQRASRTASPLASRTASPRATQLATNPVAWNPSQSSIASRSGGPRFSSGYQP